MGSISKGLGLTAEEEQFAARIADQFRLCEQKNVLRFTNFLDERQQQIAKWVIQQENNAEYQFFGGFPDAERKMLGVFPYYQQPEEDAFPITPLTVRFREADSLSHRDFLGSLMGLLIKRESLGDILVSSGCAVIFTFSPVAPIILQELIKVGRVGVSVTEGLPEVLPAAHHFIELSGTVSSLRLDCVVSLLTNCSRESSLRLIRSGLVQVNAAVRESGSHSVAEGDKISVRGYGKFLVSQVGELTKKGRIHLSCKKYS